MKKELSVKKLTILNVMLLFAVIFVLSAPAYEKECSASANTYKVSVSKGYLALRTAKAYDSRNEIGELYSGDTVEVSDCSDNQYWYVYSPKLGKSGYVNKDYLIYDGGTAASASYTSSQWTVKVSKGYLALRTAKAYDSRNEIGELYTGDVVEVTDSSDNQYWYVYSPKHGKSGYVNKDYLVSNGAPAGAASPYNWTVSVSKGYLALRTAKAYDEKNEIGELYSGDVVEVTDSSDNQYWYVYSPKHGKSGYVNKDYLIYTGTAVASTGYDWSVKVSTGYLALRTAKAYDERNEIGELYTGDVVQVTDSSDSKYWYVYSPKLNKSGYVNKDYLVYNGNSAASYAGASRGSYTMTVSVATGYLALRTAKAYDERNEIGELYSGDTVEVIDSSDAKYWYVYSPKYGKNGYVNKDYLY